MLKIGWSRKDVSTTDPLPITGQFKLRVSQGVLDPILVNILTLENNGDYVIFVQVDTVSISAGILDLIRARVSELNPEIDALKIIMNATHTHCGPCLFEEDKVWAGKPVSEVPHDGVEIKSNGEYRKWFIETVSEGIVESFEGRKEGYVSYGYGFATVAHSRRVVYFDDLSKRPENAHLNSAQFVGGHAQMYGSTRDDMFSHYEAGTDPFANFLFTFDKEEKLTGAIINVPCPSQNSEMDNCLTADYWADVRTEIAKRYGDIHILSQCAAAGDLAPRILHYKAAEERRFRLKYADYEMPAIVSETHERYRRLDIGERIAQAFDEVYGWAQKEKFDDLPIGHTVKTIELSKRLITDEEYQFCVEENEKNVVKKPFVTEGEPLEKLYINSVIMSSGGRYKGIMTRYEKQKENPKFPTEIHVIKLGNIAFATNQFELYMDYQHRIQGRSPFEQTFIIQLCGQPDGRRSGGYLATERAVAGNGYSASMYCNPVSAEGGQELVEETLAELNKLHETK